MTYELCKFQNQVLRCFDYCGHRGNGYIPGEKRMNEEIMNLHFSISPSAFCFSPKPKMTLICKQKTHSCKCEPVDRQEVNEL